MTHSNCLPLIDSGYKPVRPWALRLMDRIFAAQALHAQRQALISLDDTLLRDIGITRYEAITEVNRPIWNAPTHWRA
jgi:uncharacterized protein YjiS (DUF1127 family)